MDIRNETGAQRMVGYVITINDGAARVSLEIGENHGNRHGVLHGGFISLLLDNAMGVTSSLTASPDGRQPFLTVSMNVNFIAAARVGEVVHATASVIGGGKRLLFLQAELRKADGSLVATATGTFKQVVPPPAGVAA